MNLIFDPGGGMSEGIQKRVAVRFAKRVLGKPWGKLPKGWTDESVQKFWQSLTGDEKHKVTKCMERMEGKVDDTGAFCGSLADKILGRTDWRGPSKD